MTDGNNWKNKNFSFYSNTKCEFFPCHRTDKIDAKNFNCLFCFCPLYVLEDCGGNFKYLENGYKDCSNCLIPHSPGSYGLIIKKATEICRRRALSKLQEKENKDSFQKVTFDLSNSPVSDLVHVKEKNFVTVVGISQDNKIAFVRSAEPNRTWELPGGAVLEGETFLKAGEREFFEETGLHIQSATEVFTIENTFGKDKQVHSSVAVIVGLIDEKDTIKCTDPEIAECKLLDEVPKECTFGQDYIANLINVAIDKFSVSQNRKMWDVAKRSYSEQTFLSKKDLHYGPLLPGESSLHLLPSVLGAHVLDLGCGAGHNLAALKNLGAKSGLGIDFCTEQIEEARKNLDSSFELITGDFSDPSYVRKGKFDLVISIFSVSFISDLDNFFKIIEQNLKPGGYVVLSTDHPNRRVENATEEKTNTNVSRMQLRNWHIPDQNDVPYVRYIHSLKRLKQAITGAGLIIDTILEPAPLPFEKLNEAPYQSSYYTQRYNEILKKPYTIIFKAHKPMLK